MGGYTSQVCFLCTRFVLLRRTKLFATMEELAQETEEEIRETIRSSSLNTANLLRRNV